jgi:hypothetical protein
VNGSGAANSRPRLLPAMLAVLLAAMVVLAAVLVPVGVRVIDDASERRAADLSEVRVFENLPATHVDGDVDYSVTPPPGGPHADAWLRCGAYDRPVREENLVHSLEHGTVFIAYDPGLEEGDVALLEELRPDEGILAPYPGLRAPVVVTVWGRQLLLAGADDPRLPLFIAEYGDGATSPEPVASCMGGVVEYADSGTAV